MKKEIKANCMRALLLNLILLCVFFALLVADWQNILSDDNWAIKSAILSLVSLGSNIYFFITNNRRIGDFRVIFLIMTYPFMFGRVWIAALGMEKMTSWWLQDYFSTSVLYKTSLFCLCCIQASFLGLFFASEKAERVFRDYLSATVIADHNRTVRLYNTGLILILIAIPCRLITDVHAIIQGLGSRQYGAIEGITGFWDDFAFLLIPGVICIMESRPRSKMKWMLGLSFYFAVVMIMTGDRRYYVTGILALGLYYVNKMRKTKKKGIGKTIIYTVLVVFGLNFLEVIRSIRNGELGLVSSFLSNYGDRLFDFSTTFVDVFGEFGISFYSAASIVEYIPNSLPFQLGLSIIGSLVTIIPFGNRFLYSVAEPSNIINSYTHLTVGSSIFGDLYANFGLFAIFFSLILGILLRKWFFYLSKKKTGLSVVLCYTSYYILINLVRSSFLEIVRPFSWCVLIPLVIYNLCNRKRYSR